MTFIACMEVAAMGSGGIRINFDDSRNIEACSLEAEGQATTTGEQVFCGAVRYVASAQIAQECSSDAPVEHHITTVDQSACRNAISPASVRHGFCALPGFTSQRAKACAFICKSTSA